MQNNLPEKIENASIVAVFEAAASTEPTPGGGCVSALGGYLGISLILKAIRISAKKQPENAQIYKDAELLLLGCAGKLLVCANADSAAFGRYIHALKLPKDTEEAKTARSLALNEANIAATEVAVEIFEVGLLALTSGAALRDKVAPTILADVNGGNSLLAAMNSVACENAKSNISSMKSPGTLSERLEIAERCQKGLTPSL